MDETYATGDDWVPDFSGDDFAGDKTIMQARREAEAHRQMVNDSVEFIIRELELEESSHRNLKGFAMFKGLEAVLTESYRSVENSRLNLTVSLAEYESSYTTAKNRNIGTDLYLFGRMELKTRFPRTYICRETIREKIADLFFRRGTDFPGHKKFFPEISCPHAGQQNAGRSTAG